MKATISASGALIIYPETELDSYALDKWKDKNCNAYYNTNMPLQIFTQVKDLKEGATLELLS